MSINIYFHPGTCSVTPGAQALLSTLDLNPGKLIARHIGGDFGKAGMYVDIIPTITEEEYQQGSMATSDDGKLNVIAIKQKAGRVMSYYKIGEPIPVDVWVSTDGLGTPECYTTVLLPTEY